MVYYTKMVDSFFSYWGKAEGKENVFCVECDTLEQAEQVKKAALLRSEMSQIKILKHKPVTNSFQLISEKKFSDLGAVWHGDLSTYKKRNKNRLKTYDFISLSSFISKRLQKVDSDNCLYWTSHKLELKESDLQQLTFLISGSCGVKTRENIYRVLKHELHRVKTFGLLDRLHLNQYSLRWSYCAGQDQSVEMRAIRKELLKYA